MGQEQSEVESPAYLKSGIWTLFQMRLYISSMYIVISFLQLFSIKGLIMSKILFLFLFIYTDLALAASVFKCTIDGVTKYSQSPCGKMDNKVEKYKLETNKKNDGLTSDNEHKPLSNNKNTDELQTSAKLYTINSKIKRYQVNIAKYQKKMSKEIKILKSRTYYANNNLAGATYQAALSNEMVAVSNKYSALINLEENKIKELKSQAEKLSD